MGGLHQGSLRFVMINNRAIFSVSALLLLFIAADAAPFNNSSASLNFLVMGDWGGQGSAPYTTHQEIATAGGMGKIASSLSAPFALALGDNFYSTGVDSVDSHDSSTHSRMYFLPTRSRATSSSTWWPAIMTITAM